jgi:hypothetical protein
MPYKAQAILEEMIKILEERVWYCRSLIAHVWQEV